MSTFLSSDKGLIYLLLENLFNPSSIRIFNLTRECHEKKSLFALITVFFVKHSLLVPDIWNECKKLEKDFLVHRLSKSLVVLTVT